MYDPRDPTREPPFADEDEREEIYEPDNDPAVYRDTPMDPEEAHALRQAAQEGRSRLSRYSGPYAP